MYIVYSISTGAGVIAVKRLSAELFSALYTDALTKVIDAKEANANKDGRLKTLFTKSQNIYWVNIHVSNPPGLSLQWERCALM